MSVAIGIASLLIFLGLGMPVAFALASAGVLGMLLGVGVEPVLGILTLTPYSKAASFTLTAIPLFILMAHFMSHGGIVKDLFTAAYRWVGHLRGGLGVGTVLANAGFGALCGSSTAACAAFSEIVIPEMRRCNYSAEYSSGVVAIAGTLAIMIPPSIPLLVYGIQTETSIGKLLIAGILPGLLTAAVYSIAAVVLGGETSDAMRPQRSSWKARFASLRSLWAALGLSVLVLGSIYGGIATPTEAAAIGALGAGLLGWSTGRMNLHGTIQALLQTLQSTVMIFTIIIGATIFGYFLTATGVTQSMISALASLAVSRWVIFGLIVVLYLILGCLLDPLAIMLLTLPLVFPVVIELGFDPIWFGIMQIVFMEIGVITPPVGLNVYVVSGVSKIPLATVFKGGLKFLMFETITVVLLIMFPQISLFLPSRMMRR